MEYEIRDALFLLSSPSLKACPKSDMPEFAFIGRSNVGKSSLINMITKRKTLAKTSSTPGKTRLINFFLVNNSWRLVDLPGYGFAKLSKGQRSEFREVITDYIAKRDNLYCVFVLLDTRIPPQDIDIRFINWLGNIGVPFLLVGTKTDKISLLELSKFEKDYQQQLSKTWEELPKMIFTSAIKKTGRSEILYFIGASMLKQN
jgi:GTP-binding protein